jgi:hypothetical protein
MTASPAAPGMPSEEEIAGVICDWQMKPGFDDWNAKVAALVAELAALIRPAFEAKEREIERLTIRALRAIDERELALASATAAEANLAQVAEALEHAEAYLMSIGEGDGTDGARIRKAIAAIRARTAAARGEKT